MFDRETLLVSYDRNRGEGTAGRAKPVKELKQREDRQTVGVGDCIDCGYCVQVCPTGIDIRNGLQIACISCGLCIDACNEIMDKQGWPRGLIRYASEHELETGEKPRVFKLKTIGYGLAITAVTIGLIWGLLIRAPMDFAVNQIRQPLFVTLADGRIQNSYEVKVNNKTMNEIDLELSVVGLSGVEMEFGGEIREMRIPPEASRSFLIRIKGDRVAGETQRPFDFMVSDRNGNMPSFTKAATFNTP
jgi:cytochrome c oxidase accessory protein FixG